MSRLPHLILISVNNSECICCYTVPGLFHRAILQSGTDQNRWSINVPESVPETYTQQVAEALGCETEDTSAMIDCLRQQPWEDVADVRITCTVRRMSWQRDTHKYRSRV